MKAQHTPGPWKIEPVFIAQSTCESLHFGEYQFPPERTATGSSKVYSREEAEANARLIAAAPEMLEALEFYRRLLDAFIREKQRGKVAPIGRLLNCMNLVNAAIRKARGAQ